MITFPIHEAYLIGAWFSSALWGILTCLVTYCLYYISPRIRKGSANRSQYITTGAVVILYLLATAHLSLALRRLIVGFIDNEDDSMDYFADIGQPLNRGKDLIYITSMIIADSIVVWRCWSVWGQNNYVIILPVALVLGTCIAGYASIAQYFLKNPDRKVSIAWGRAMFCISLATNVVVTLMTAGRIWYLSRWIGRDNFGAITTKYRTIVLLIIESGAVIAAAKVTEFTLFQVSGDGLEGNNALYVVYETMPQWNALMPTIIIIAVLTGRVLDSGRGTRTKTVASNLVFAGPSTSTKVGHLSQPEGSNDGFGDSDLQSRGIVTQKQFGETELVTHSDVKDLEA